MAKYYGPIGYVHSIETSPGIWEDVVTEYSYYGDIIRNTRKLQPTSGVNDNILINNEISIVSDPYANENFYALKYATYMGIKWKVTLVEVLYPKLILTLGGEYHGPQN